MRTNRNTSDPRHGPEDEGAEDFLEMIKDVAIKPPYSAQLVDLRDSS
jgi:hypothetical protein